MDEGIVRCESHTLQEDLIFTELSREQKLIEFYNSKEKRDGHNFVAKMCFPEILKDTPEQQVKSKFPELRSQAKKAKFSIHYGGNGATIAKNLRLPIELGISIEWVGSGLEEKGIDAYSKKMIIEVSPQFFRLRKSRCCWHCNEQLRRWQDVQSGEEMEAIRDIRDHVAEIEIS